MTANQIITLIAVLYSAWAVGIGFWWYRLCKPGLDEVDQMTLRYAVVPIALCWPFLLAGLLAGLLGVLVMESFVALRRLLFG